MRSVAASIHPSARKGLSENLAKAKFSEVRVHDAAQYTVSLPLRERDEGRDDALPAGLHAGISLR
jgi:hypothetical protein